jgi:methionine-rich copper-binding protein CopC
LPLLEPGHYVVAVTAYDEAGNTTTGESDFTVEGIEAPKITYYPRELTVGDVFKVRGTSYADADIELTIYDKDGNEVTVEPGKSNSLNDFAITLSKRLGPGEYTFSVRATDSRGARSPLTEPVKFSVGFHLVADALAFAANYFIIVVIFLLAVAGVAAVGIWSFYRLLHLSSTLRKERKEAETTIKKAFRLLKGDLEDHIARLHRARSDRTLTAEELSFLEQFEKDLREAEDIIKDEFDDIPKA